MRRTHPTGPLRPAELAEAAVLADLSAAMLFMGWLLPLGGILEILAIVPLAALNARRRARAGLGATVAASSICFLVGGVGLWSWAVVLGLIGLCVGGGVRRRWGPVRVALEALWVWAAVSAITIGQFLLFPRLRKLSLDQFRNTWRGARNILGHVTFLHPLLHVGDQVVSWCLVHWYVVIAVGELFAVEVAAVVAVAVSTPAVRRLERSLGRPAPVPVHDDGAPGPVPVTLEEAVVRYPDAIAPTLTGVNLRVEPGRFVVVVGPNGSGKSTLARVLAGIVEAEGDVTRPGSIALGHAGGTAVIFQRPESQVLGVRARDDVVWGLPPPDAVRVDVEALLERVGLAGMGDVETSTLSGGQLQRLAIAAALARRPALLVSDESTSMLDPTGRRQVVDLLQRLARSEGVAVVHITHRDEELAGADAVVKVEDGRVIPGQVPA